MARLHAAPPVDPATLSTAERDRLAHDLYAVQSQIFDGVTLEGFRAYVVDSPAQRNRIQVFSDADTGEVVGFAATHVFTVELERRTVDLLRTEVGLLPAYRGQSAAGRLLLQEGARLAARSVVRDAYFLACPVHPASYWAAARTSRHIWPRPEAATPAHVQETMDQLDVAIGLTRPDYATSAGVRKVGWITRQTDEEHALWNDHDSALVQFYVDQNPTYTQGDGLMMVAPLTAAAVLSSGWSLVCRQARRMMVPRRRAVALTQSSARRQAA